MARIQFAVVFCMLAGFAIAPEQVEEAKITSLERQAGGDENKRYFLIGPREAEKPPEAGHGLLVVLPGGDGSADFRPFVERILKRAAPEGYVVAQPVAVKWTEDQRIVWPTQNNPVPEQQFSTEEFIKSVIEDVNTVLPVDERRVFCMGWSSSGPALYAAALVEEPIAGGFYIAMSVFKPRLLPPLERAEGRLFYIEHSPDDRVCPYRMALDAKKRLGEAGAIVEFSTYEGGHGWRGDVYGRIRRAIRWFETRTSDDKGGGDQPAPPDEP
ncbi:MAG: hypothetical protein JSV91_12700 [Phycisphaerales bacterium]|nr:MAG: hypothetical protein JSV91_12700 [Phycisphaerales bacterium]